MLLTANTKLRKTVIDRVHDTADNLLRFVEGLARSNPLVCEPEEWTDRTIVIKCVPSAVSSRRAMNGRTTAIVVGRRDKLMMRHTCVGLLLARPRPARRSHVRLHALHFGAVRRAGTRTAWAARTERDGRAAARAAAACLHQLAGPDASREAERRARGGHANDVFGAANGRARNAWWRVEDAARALH